MAEPRQTAPKPAALVVVGLLGLAGMVYLLWPKPALVEHTARSEAGSSWDVRADKAVLTGPTMGTTFSVILARPSSAASFEARALAQLQPEVDAALEAVNAEMSTYRPDSQLSQFNAAQAGQAVPVSAELIELVELSRVLSDASEGAFDVTVGPLVDAWGFGPDPRTRHEPEQAELDALRARVGLAKLEVDRKAQTLRKQAEGLRVDLSAIAKGHGCDRVAGVLDAAGHTHYMIEIGGEVRVRGRSPSGEPWRVGIEKPSPSGGDARVVHQMVRVSDVSVATSGDYRNYWEREGVRYSHTLDARTGRPITHRLASVTVIHPQSAALADAWATALNVLGPEAGLALAEDRGLAAYFLVRVEDGFEAKSSSAFLVYQP